MRRWLDYKKSRQIRTPSPLPEPFPSPKTLIFANPGSALAFKPVGGNYFRRLNFFL